MLRSNVVKEGTAVAGTEGAIASTIAEEIWEVGVVTMIGIMMTAVDLPLVTSIMIETPIVVDRLLDIEVDPDLVLDLLLDIVQEVLAGIITTIDLLWVVVAAADHRHHLEDQEVFKEEEWVGMIVEDMMTGIIEIAVIVGTAHDQICEKES